MTSPSNAGPVRLVLDTNVVLDWLVFRDPASQRLGQAIGDGQARWLANDTMRRELEHVLTRGCLDAWEPDLRAVMRSWERFVTPMPDPVPTAPARLRCTDPDDQVFIDLALGSRASALLSRDRAVLRLARTARAFGLLIQPPSAWRLGPGELGE